MSTKLLKKHQKTDIRFQDGDFILYEPNREQYEQIKKLVEDNTKLNEELDLEGTVIFSQVRFIIRELTNIGYEVDEYSDEELETLLNNGDRQIKALLHSITSLLDEVAESVYLNYVKQVKAINSYLKVINNSGDMANIEREFNKLCKKNKLGITFEDLLKVQNDGEASVNDVLSKIKK